MKMRYFITLFLAAIITTSFSCQQKKNSTAVSNELPNDSIPISPTTMAPNIADKKTGDERKDTVPVVRIAIQQMQAQLLDSGSQIGKPGDLLLTFTGSGFVFTDKNPAVVAGGMRFEETYINEKGTELYAVIPAGSKERMAAAARGGLQVVNPGKQPATATIKEQTTEIIKRADSDKKVKLVFGKFGVERRE